MRIIRRIASLFAVCALLSALAVVTLPVQAQSGTLAGVLWKDTNCNGLRESSEGPPPFNVQLGLVHYGFDRTLYTADDRLVEYSYSGLIGGSFSFGMGGPYGDTYYLVIYNQHKPAGYAPAPFQRGSDRTLDNDLYYPVIGSPLWATPGFQMLSSRATLTGIDIGLAPDGSCTNAANDQKPVLYLPLLQR